MSFIPITEVNKETSGANFCPIDLVGSDFDKKSSARKTVWIVAEMMCEENKQRIITNRECCKTFT